MRVGDILRCNGWTKAFNPKRIDGKLQRYWERVVTGSNRVVTEVVTPQNPYPDSVSETLLLPVTTFLVKDSSEIEDIATYTANKYNNSESEESFESEVVTPPPYYPQNGLEQELQPVTTSNGKGSNTLRNFSLPGTKETTFAIGDLVEITLRSDYQGYKGKIADIGTGAREIDYYVKIENEKVLVTIPMGADSFPYLRKPSPKTPIANSLVSG